MLVMQNTNQLLNLKFLKGNLKRLSLNILLDIIRFHQPSGKILKSLLMFITLK